MVVFEYRGMVADIIGFAAGILIAVSMIPQVAKAYKTKSVQDLSFLMLLIIALGTAFWMAYGIMIASLPIVTMDGFGFLVNAVLIFMKIRYGK